MEAAPSPPSSYREFSPLDHLVSRVPHLGRLGRQQDLTSLTASPDFLALGTSCGSVYWYSRREDSLQRLDCWRHHTAVTCLALVETTDLMLAAGSEQGDLTIFQIPKPVLPDIGLPFPGTVQDIQEFSIRKVHTGASISALCWAINGERLFSGDTGGRLAVSLVDFFKNTVQTSLLSVEPGQIRALSYLQRTLLVSSAGQTVVVELGRESGLAERRLRVGEGGERPGGSSLLQSSGVGRPGLRCLLVRPDCGSVVVTDTAGTLVSSLSVRRGGQAEIPVVNPISIAREEEGGQWENIGVLSAQEQTVLLWSKVSLHLVSLLTGSLVASCRSLRNILDLAVTSSGEIFVLETRRSVVRLGLTEDSLAPATDWRRGSTVSQAADTRLGANLAGNIPRFPLLNSLAGSLSSELRSLKEKLREKRSSPVEEVEEEVEEAILGLDYSKSGQTSPEFKTRMDRIGEAEFTADIVQQRSPRRYKKVRSIREKTGDSEETLNSSDNSGDIGAETPTTTTTSSDIAGASGDLLSTEEKELALMKILRIQQEEEEEESREEPAPAPEVDDNNTETLASLGYGPPSDSVEHRSLQSLGREEPDLACGEREGEEREMESQARPETEGWESYEVPGPAVSLAETRHYLVLCDDRENVFYSSLAGAGTSLTWRRADYPASEVRTSPSGGLVWRLHQGTAFCLLQPREDKPAGSGWLEICRKVASLALTETTGWLVKLDGGLVVHQDLSPSCPSSSRPRQIYTGHFITEVRQVDDLLLARTNEADLLLARLEMLAEETAWQPLLVSADSQERLKVASFEVSPAGELWVVGRREEEEEEESSEVVVSSDWRTRGLTGISWSALLSPPLSRPLVLPTQSRLWVSSGLSSSLLSHTHPVSTFLWARLDISAQLSSLRVQRVHGGGREAYSGHLLLQLARGGSTRPALLQLDLAREIYPGVVLTNITTYLTSPPMRAQ